MTAADPVAHAIARVQAAAAASDHHDATLADEIDWLRDAGLIAGALPSALSGGAGWGDDPLATLALLRRLGAASLPVGRVVEGHVNAVQLIALYATPALRAEVTAAVRQGALLGVWGADGADPLRGEPAPDGIRLTGGKSFCSGLGLVAQALVSAQVEGRTRLLCVAVGDPVRADPGQWRVSGMRATASGGYDFTGLVIPAAAVVGGPDAYYAEPHFLGGMYRMCAVQVGGLDALLAEAIAALRRRGRAGDPLARLRIGEIASLRALAASITADVARGIAADAPPEAIAEDAVLMREGVEGAIVRALGLAERALGTELHREDRVLSRLRRDLSFYIRQAAVDERLMAVGARLLAE